MDSYGLIWFNMNQYGLILFNFILISFLLVAILSHIHPDMTCTMLMGYRYDITRQAPARLSQGCQKMGEQTCKCMYDSSIYSSIYSYNIM